MEVLVVPNSDLEVVTGNLLDFLDVSLPVGLSDQEVEREVLGELPEGGDDGSLEVGGLLPATIAHVLLLLLLIDVLLNLFVDKLGGCAELETLLVLALGLAILLALLFLVVFIRIIVIKNSSELLVGFRGVAYPRRSSFAIS